MIIDGDAANISMIVIELKTELFARIFKDVEGDFHHFRSDTIAGEYCEFECFHIQPA